MTDNGLTTKKMEKGNSLMLRENFTMEILKTVSFMEMGFITTRMEMNIEVSGQITNKMVKESSPGKMKMSMKDSIKMA